MTQEQLKDEAITNFNKQFKNTDWYPNNWKPIEQFLLSQLEKSYTQGVNDALEILKSYNFTDTELYDEIKQLETLKEDK